MDPLRHHEIFVDTTARIVTLVRTARPFASAHELEEETAFFAEAVRGIERARYGLVIDARHGPGTHNDALDEPFSHFRRAVMRGFRGVAVVTTSAAGKLHVKRIARDDRVTDLAVFGTVEEARAHLGARSERRVREGASTPDGLPSEKHRSGR